MKNKRFAQATKLSIAIILMVVSGFSCTKSDPTPVTKSANGQVVFWTDVDDHIGNVEVTLNGVKQTCTKVTSVLGPACGQAGFASFQFPDGTYSFTAKELVAPSRKWSGSVAFTANQCAKWKLNP